MTSKINFIRAFKVTNAQRSTIFENADVKISDPSNPFLRVRDCEIIEHNQNYLLIKYDDEYYIVYRKDFPTDTFRRNSIVKSIYIISEDYMEDSDNIELDLEILCNSKSYYSRSYKGNHYHDDFIRKNQSIDSDDITNVMTIKEHCSGYFFVIVCDIRNNYHIVGYSKHESVNAYRIEELITSF